jgi:hypothetical protein
MQRYRECPSCRALLSQDQLTTTEGICSYCDARVGEPGEYANPAAAPDDLRRRRPLAPLAVPDTLGGKLATALFLLLEQFPVIAGLVLLIKLPSNFGILWVVQENPNPVGPREILMLRSLVELFFGPIYLAGVVTLLANRMSGRPTTVVEAARSGLHNWPRLFAARVACGFFILLFTLPGIVLAFGAGFVVLGVLLCIVPGIILAVRYSFIDEAVVLEGVSVADSRARSTALTAGRGLRIFSAGLISVVSIAILVGSVEEMTAQAGLLDDPLSNAAFVSFADVFGVFVTIVLFLHYWEAIAEQQYAAQAAESKDFEVDEL